MNTIEEVDAISEKMELLLRKLDERAKVKKDREAIQQYASARARESRERCEVQDSSYEVAINGHPQQGGMTSRF